MQKTIKINPELFVVGKQSKSKVTNNRSQKNRSQNLDQSRNNKIRQKLLDKIKNFQKNNQQLDPPSSQKSHRSPNNSSHNDKQDINNDLTSFDDSLTFLDNLSNNYHTQKQRRSNHTFKNRNGAISTTHEVSNELPDELFNTSSTNTNTNANTNTNTSFKSYGCLKNGSLPTFREWKRMTQKNRESVTPNSSLTTASTSNPNESKLRLKIATDNNQYYENRPLINPVSDQTMERQQRLNDIKNQFKGLKQETTTTTTQPNPVLQQPIPVLQQPNPVLTQPNPVLTQPNPVLQQPNPVLQQPNPVLQQPNPVPVETSIKEHKIETLDDIEVYNIPKILRKTKTLKFKLGRNNKNRKIGIYIKNRETLKNIKRDFNQLKQVDIGEVKKYLRKHNLINTGSSSPNDVLREIYEKAILSGDVTNKNTTNLITNFMNEED